jgi:DNA-binding MarR family transcriptional regulator
MNSAKPTTAQATLTASRALLGVIARSVAGALEVVSLPQFRVLVLLSVRGRTRFGALADLVGANPSTFSRAVDRMVAGGLVDRSPSPESRREVLIGLTELGRSLVEEVTSRRRDELSLVLDRLSPSEQESVRVAMELFANAAGEPSNHDLLVLGI